MTWRSPACLTEYQLYKALICGIEHILIYRLNYLTRQPVLLATAIDEKGEPANAESEEHCDTEGVRKLEVSSLIQRAYHVHEHFAEGSMSLAYTRLRIQELLLILQLSQLDRTAIGFL